MTGPTLVLVGDDTTPQWRIEMRGFEACLGILGRDVMREFCRCFIHADRVTSLTSAGYLSYKHYKQPSTGLDRNIQTTLWFAIGTFRELSLALADLRTAVTAKGWYRPEDEHWARLYEVESRWKDDAFFRKWRSKVSFHVDRRMVERGLVKLAEEETVVLGEGQGGHMDGGWLNLGLEALLAGAEIEYSELERLFEAASQDHNVALAIQHAFCNVAELAGLPTARE